MDDSERPKLTKAQRDAYYREMGLDGEKGWEELQRTRQAERDRMAAAEDRRDRKNAADKAFAWKAMIVLLIAIVLGTKYCSQESDAAKGYRACLEMSPEPSECAVPER